MIRQVGRLAMASTWRGGRTDRARAATVAFGVAIAAFVICAVASTMLMLDHASDRSASRNFAPARPGEAPAMQMSDIPDLDVDGNQIYVHWWRFEDSTARIPGVPGQPAPGSWFVSPALKRSMGNQPRLAERFPGARVIGDEGIVNADELVAYRFVDSDTPLKFRLSSRTTPSGQLGDPVDLEASSVVRSAIVLLAVPILGLLLAALAPASVGLEERLGLLRALGASKGTRTTVTVVHALTCALPGAVIGTLGWLLVAPRLTSVPIVGRSILPGELRLPVGVALGVGLATLAILGLLAVLQGRRRAGNRPTASLAAQPGRERLIPLVGGLVAMVLGGGVVTESNGTLFVAGLMTAAIGAVVSLPLLFAATGDAVGEGRSALALLVGRRLRWTATTAARTMLALTALAVVVPVASSWIDLTRARVSDGADVTPNLAPTGIRGPVPGSELQELLEKTGGVAIRVVSPGGRSSPAPSADARLLGDCTALQRVVDVSTCGEDGFRLGPTAAAAFARFGVPTAGSAAVRPGEVVTNTLILAEDWRMADNAIRSHLNNRQQLWFSAMAIVNPTHESPLTRWALGGIAVAILIALTALIVQQVAASGQLARSRSRLSALGTSKRSLGLLAAGESAAALLLAGASATALGLLGSWLFTVMNPDARVAFGVAVISLLALLALSFGAAGAAWLGSQSGSVGKD